MPMSELFAYFDPNHDGSTEPQELIKGCASSTRSRDLSWVAASPSAASRGPSLANPGHVAGSTLSSPPQPSARSSSVCQPPARVARDEHGLPGGRAGGADARDPAPRVHANPIRERPRRSKRQGLRQSAVDEASERTLAANDAKLKLGALMRQNMAKTTDTRCAQRSTPSSPPPTPTATACCRARRRERC